MFKGYLFYKTIFSKNVSIAAQITKILFQRKVFRKTFKKFNKLAAAYRDY